jgi:hypothetical protein
MRGEERAAISPKFRNDQEAGAFADICPASWGLYGESLSTDKYQ